MTVLDVRPDVSVALPVAAPLVDAPPKLAIEGVTLRYQTATHLITAVDHVSVAIRPGERVMFLGPSGCGKSTLLKAIGGYLRPVEGRLLLNGRPTHRPGPDRAMVFQEFDQLLAWKSVRENVAFAVRVARGLTRVDALAAADSAIELVGLSRFARAFPHTLSGGMKMRVAIARCIALQSEVVLMDEPFAALDALTRQKLQIELLRLWERLRFTLVFVTHGIDEAFLLGTRVIVFSAHPGRVRDDLNLKGNDINALRARVDAMLLNDAPETTA